MLWWEWLLLLVLLSVFFAQVYLASPQKSAAFDEQYHLAAGYSYLKTGDFRLANNHPPLAGLIASIGLWRRGEIVLPLDHPSWEQGHRFLFAEAFLWQANDDPQAILEAARLPIMILGLLLQLTIWLWARQLWGRWAGWIALFLAVFDANLIANSRLVTTDLPLTFFLFLAMWRLWCWLGRPSWINLILVGILAGLAMTTKYTGLLFWPVALLCLLIYPTEHPKWLWQRLGGLVVMGLIGLITLWAVFRFEVGLASALPGNIPLPAPFYWQSVWGTFIKLPGEAGAKLNFLLGQVSAEGWWYYFPVALAVKTALPTLILFIIGVVALLREGKFRDQVCLWLPPLAFLLLALTGVLTIGYRHILPAVPFLIMLAGCGGLVLVSKTSRQKPWPAVVVVILLLWTAVGVLRIYPHQEAFFNELAGDWHNWSRILVDSNLDWGQDLIALRQLMHDYGLQEVNLAYFGMASPEAYGIQYRPLPGYLRFVSGPEVAAFNPYTPAPGWYAISATSLRLGVLSPETADYYAYFQDQEPINRAGYSIYLYQVPDDPQQPVNHVAVTGKPVGQHTAAELGIQPREHTAVRWSDSPNTTIYPGGKGFDASFQPVGANFEDVVTLLGYSGDFSYISPASTIEMTLYWQVGDNPMPSPKPANGPPLAAFVHLTGEEVWRVLAQHDGWPTALRGLEPGDIVAQKTAVWVNEQAPSGEYHLLVGLYSPQTMIRLQPDTVLEGEDFIRLEKVEVK